MFSDSSFFDFSDDFNRVKLKRIEANQSSSNMHLYDNVPSDYINASYFKVSIIQQLCINVRLQIQIVLNPIYILLVIYYFCTALCCICIVRMK